MTSNGDYSDLLPFCTYSPYYVREDGVSSGKCTLDEPCDSFETVLKKLVGNTGEISVLGSSFSNGDVMIVDGVLIRIMTYEETVESVGMSVLTYSLEGSETAFFTVDKSELRILNMSIVFGSVNKGPFVSLLGLVLFLFRN
jgi:hypothetical protein